MLNAAGTGHRRGAESDGDDPDGGQDAEPDRAARARSRRRAALVASALARHGSLTKLAPDSIATVGCSEPRWHSWPQAAEQRNTRRLLNWTPRVGPDERFVRMVAWAVGHGYVRPGLPS